MRNFSIDLIWAKIQIAITAIGGWLGYFLGGIDGLMIALLIFMTLDYITGVMCAIVDKKLSSAVGFKGVCKKVLILFMVGIANIVDLHVIGSGSALRGAVIAFYLSNEGLSLLENAAYLNARGIKTKRGTSLWRGTSVRALIDNPMYIGIYHMQGVQSEPFDHLKIIDESLFERCQQTVKGRSTKNFGRETPVPLRTSSRCLLTGILYCADCGSRMTFAHNETKRKMADGTIKVYERDMYRCYRKISSKFTCAGQTSYDMKLIDPAVEAEVRKFLVQLGDRPREELMEIASARNVEAYQIAMQQAEKDLENAQRQVTALEEEAVKALTGESQLDLSIVNSMLVKHRARMDAAEQALTTARAKLEAETQNAKETKAQIDELLSWAECFDKANTETKHMIMARLIERVDLGDGYKVHIKFKISKAQFEGAHE